MSCSVYKQELATGQESPFHKFEYSLVQEFKFFQDFGVFRGFCEICEFWVLQTLLRAWLSNWSSGGDKKLYCV